jgi:FkbM family methyltransferase
MQNEGFLNRVLRGRIGLLARIVHSAIWVRCKARKSYSQFGEDAVLRNLLAEMAYHGIEVPQRGWYVDIGAFSPIQFSNSYDLYLRGWRGLVVDATPGTGLPFRILRPRDQFANVAVGSESKVLPFYTWGAPMVMNTADPEVAKEFARVIGREPTVVEVELTTLASLLEKHRLDPRVVAMVSIDVEGYSTEVLRGIDWDTLKPLVFVVETDTVPLRGIEPDSSTTLLESVGYVPVAVAGPSTFFVQVEHARRIGRRK